jgi:glycosyltransferase involved in cell wall biosynthesis
MRIGMMADVYKPHVSGITNYIDLNKRFLERAGHQVFVFTFADGLYQDEEPQVIHSPGLPLLSTGYHLSINYSRAARKLLYSMDVVHVHHPFVSGSLALRSCRPRGIPVVFTNHTRYDLYAQVYLPNVPEVVSEAALRSYMPIFCRGCDLVIAPSEGVSQVLREFGVDAPVEVVPNGVDLTPFTAIKDPIEREALGFSAQEVALIYTGRLGVEKNLDFLLRCFSGAAKAFDHLRLLVVGDGPIRNNLQERVEMMGVADKVRFTGMVPYAEMPRYLAAADAYVTASVTEVHPLSVIEAMAAGLPVLGIQSPGVGDTIQNDLTGYLVADQDIAAFTAQLIRLATDSQNRRRMGNNAREAAQDYAIERTVGLMEQRYRRVIEASLSRKKGWRATWTRMMDQWRN